MQTLAQVKLKTHFAHIAQNQDTGKIIVFKYTANRCDLDTFDCGEQAGEYILEPFPESYYAVELSESNDSNNCE